MISVLFIFVFIHMCFIQTSGNYIFKCTGICCVSDLKEKQQFRKQFLTPLHLGLFLASLWTLCLVLDFLNHQERSGMR
jgi:hypothetical protein